MALSPELQAKLTEVQKQLSASLSTQAIVVQVSGNIEVTCPGQSNVKIIRKD